MAVAQSEPVTLDEPSPSPAFGAGIQPAPARPTIPDYELLKFVDRGSYGDVWLARSVTGLYRAVKIVWRARFPDPQPYEREFKGLKEFAAISLSESRQLALLHVGRTEEFFYYVMELADDAETGREIDPERYRPNTLKEVRERRGRLPAAEVVTLGVELARGLGALHAHGLVHRDIKPSNVIYVGGAPKLADIGLVATASAALTFVGTEGYVPPEGPGAPAADVFSLGKVLYELATGLDRRDYPILPAELTEFSDRRELLELNAVIVRACEPYSRNRFPDATALRDELLLLQAGKSVRRLRTMERRTARALRAAGVLGAVAIIAGAGAWVERTRLIQETRLRQQAETALTDYRRKSLYIGALEGAGRALEDADLGLARQALSEAVPRPGETDLRGFEWGALWNEAQGDAQRVARVPNHAIKQLFPSPDGRLLAGQIDDDRAVLWASDTLQEIRTIKGPHLLAGFSSDGEWLVGTNASAALQRWQVDTGVADPNVSSGINFPALPIGADEVLAQVKNEHAAAGGLRVWDFAQNREVRAIVLKLPNPESWTFGPHPAVTRDRSKCAVALFRSEKPKYTWHLQVYAVGSGELLFDQIHHEFITRLAFSSDGRFLAAAFIESNEVGLIELSTGRNLWRQPVEMSQVSGLAFSFDDAVVALGGTASFVRMLDTKTGKPVGLVNGHDVGVLDICWPVGSRRVFTAGSGGDLRCWEPASTLRSGEIGGLWAGTVGFSTNLCISCNGEYVAANAEENTLVIIKTGKTSRELTRVEGRIPVAFDRRGSSFLAISRDGMLREYSLGVTGLLKQERRVLPEGSVPRKAQLSRDGRHLVIGGEDGQVWFWDRDSERLSSQPAGKTPMWWIALTPDGTLAATGSADFMVRVWSTADGKLIREWKPSSPANDAAFSPDGRRLALGFSNGEGEVRRVADWSVEQGFKTTASWLNSIAFSHDGRRLFCAANNGHVYVFSSDDWRKIFTFRTHVDSLHKTRVQIQRLAASESGNVLAAYQANGSLRIWLTDESLP